MIGPFPMERFLDLHRQLAVTPGPSLDEGPRRAVLEAFFSGTPLRARTDAAGNLWVSTPGEAPWAETLVLDAHIDVVERGYVTEVQRDGDLLRGLGVGDNLGAVAMLALAMARLGDPGGGGQRPITALFSVGEEGLGNLRGMRQAVADRVTPPFLFVALDGSLGTFSMTGLGSRRYRTRITCPGGHSWGDFGSPNAIEVLLESLSQVRQRYRDLAETTDTRLSFNLGTIAGGAGINSIARAAEATYEFRSPSASLLARMQAQLDQVLRDADSRDSVSVRHQVIGTRPGAGPVNPERVRQRIEPAWNAVVEDFDDTPMSTNINVPLAAGWPAVCVGVCSYTHSHTENETLNLTSLEKGWQCLERLVRRQLSNGPDAAHPAVPS